MDACWLVVSKLAVYDRVVAAVGVIWAWDFHCLHNLLKSSTAVESNWGRARWAFVDEFSAARCTCNVAILTLHYQLKKRI